MAATHFVCAACGSTWEGIRAPCPSCAAYRFETFTYDIPGYPPMLYNVSAAKVFAARGDIVATVEIDREEMRNIVARNAVDMAHVPDVDPTIPGIAAPFVWEGQIQYMLIDGTHRVAKALQLGVGFHAHLLTDAAAQRCVLSAPAVLLPWGAVEAGTK